MDTQWHVLGASVRGTSHEAHGTPCQDSHSFQALDHGRLIVAVADGAGSGQHSEVGSQIAVQSAMVALVVAIEARYPWDETGWEDVMHEAFRRARETLEEMVTEELSLRDLATTLTCALVTRSSLVVGQIGDSLAVVQDLIGRLSVPIPPQKGEYASETFFLTMDDALDLVEVEVAIVPPKGLALMSDGLTRLALKLPEYEPSTRFFDPLWAFAAEAHDLDQAQEELAAFLGSERVSARTDDDKTLVLATRRT